MNVDTLSVFSYAQARYLFCFMLGANSVEEITKLDKFTATPFRQELELHNIEHEAGFTTLRVRIREKSRFTIFDIDPQTAEAWGSAMVKWAQQQNQKGDSK